MELSEIKRLQGIVERYCLSMTGSRWDAEDLAQETWLKVLEKAGGPNHHNPEALLLRAAKNKWIDLTRRKAVLERIMRGQERQAERFDDQFIGLEAILQTLNEHMTHSQLAVFLLRELFACTTAETAVLLGMTEGGVKAALFRARQSLEDVRADLEAESAAGPDEADAAFVHTIAAACRQQNIPMLAQACRHEPVRQAAAGTMLCMAA